MPLIGMFINLASDDPEISTRRDGFLRGLGPQSNLRIAMRFGGDGGNNIVDGFRDLRHEGKCAGHAQSRPLRLQLLANPARFAQYTEIEHADRFRRTG